MCAVSVISQYGRDRIPRQQWTTQSWGEYQEILRRLESLDAKLGQPDCDTEDKTAWMREVEERLAKLEQASPP